MNAARSLSPFARMPLAAAALAVALAGCGGDRAWAPRVADATLDATLVRLADGSVSVHAVATNTGNVTIECGASCDEVWIDMSVHGPNGPIRLMDPCAVGVYCPSGYVPLAPGGRAERQYTYDGRQYGEACYSLGTIPPGRYEIVATFGWRAQGSPWTTLTRRLPFDWPAP
ncbi:MAG: hypothetical protein ACRENJ_03145 [Candidatus Eiseniibacteriota bacterium]